MCNKPFFNHYSAAIAFAGQTPAQEPQEMQLPASITRVPSPLSEIAPTGHCPSHAPQERHAEESITYAIVLTPHIYKIMFLSFIIAKKSDKINTKQVKKM